jgi:hypothetical protein
MNAANNVTSADSGWRALLAFVAQRPATAEFSRCADPCRQVVKALFSAGLLVSLVLACRSADPIDRLVTRLSDMGGPRTYCGPVHLPATASPEEVAVAALDPLRNEMNAEKILQVREVHIKPDMHTYTAVLVETKGTGRWIVLLYCLDPNKGIWWTQLHDAKESAQPQH